MAPSILPPDPELFETDIIILKNLHHDIQKEVLPKDSPASLADDDDESTRRRLEGVADVPSVFCTWDLKDIPAKGAFGSFLRAYVAWAQTVVRHPTDVVFLTHLILHFSTSVPSALYLYHHFSYLHGVVHWIMQLYYCGSFTLMLHNHIHNDGILSRQYSWLDRTWPYVLEPLMGHTWDSYYYHHVKHHHVEGNGPEDLSSTLRYQRDSLPDFLLYVGRFLVLIWMELPLYFLRKKRHDLAAKSFFSEVLAYAFIAALARRAFLPTLFVLMLPLVQMRIGLMVGNFGQHALIDEADPASDLRASITLIDVPSNRYCFNDGWHTSHHLHPRRHWRQHPAAFLRDKPAYREGRALVFQRIDYLMMTYRLLCKDYAYLAERIVPMGEQIGMSREELADMLRTKTKRFTEEQIQEKFYSKRKARKN